MESAKLYINRCLQLARLGEYHVAPNPMVGAILVHHSVHDVILGEGWHEQYGAAHAEPNCIRHAETSHPEGIDINNVLYMSVWNPVATMAKRHLVPNSSFARE